MNDLYGWHAAAAVGVQAYDPPHDAPCPYCGRPLTGDDVRTITFVTFERPHRRFFYRMHRTCDTDASADQQQAVFDGVIARIMHDGVLE